MVKKLILIGASTGGPGLLEKILSWTPDDFDATFIIAQHMHSLSLRSFAMRLNRIISKDIVYVEDKVFVESKKVYIIADTFKLKQDKNDIYLEKAKDEKGFYHPDIDILFKSSLEIKSKDVYIFLLSGIGSDGAFGMLEAKKQGIYTCAQDEDSSIVYGMPKSAKEIGACLEVLNIDEIIDKIRRIV